MNRSKYCITLVKELSLIIVVWTKISNVKAANKLANNQKLTLLAFGTLIFILKPFLNYKYTKILYKPIKLTRLYNIID